MMKGQISVTWVLGIAASIALAAFGSMAASNVRTDSKLGSVKDQVFTISERTAKLETSVPIIKDDIKEIKQSLKNIETYFRIPPKP